MQTELKMFEGQIGMAAVGERPPLSPPGLPSRVSISVGPDAGGYWKAVGVLEFNADGRKTSFALTDDFKDAARGTREAEWTGREVPADEKTRRPSRDYILAHCASRLADQIRGLSDAAHYAENPVHLPYTGEQVLRVLVP